MTNPLLRFLRQDRGVFYCAPCIARAEHIPAGQVEKLWSELVLERTVEFTQGQCVDCLKVRTVVRVRANRSS